MSVADTSFEQPASFEFSGQNKGKIQAVLNRYPAERKASAVMPLLDLAQRQHSGWLPRAAMDHVAELLDMAPIRVYEVATFYSMYNLAPVGEHVVRVCTTTPCALRGSGDLVQACRDRLKIDFGGTTADGKFTLQEVECLGACVNAPVVWIDDDYYEDLDGESLNRILEAMVKGDAVKAGSQTGRKKSAPATGPTTLTGQGR